MNENQGNVERPSKQEATGTPKKSRKGLKIFLIIAGSIFVLGCGAVGLFVLRKYLEYNRDRDQTVNTIFASSLNLMKKVSGKNGTAEFEVIRQLPFGTEVELHDKDVIHQDGKTYHRCIAFRLRPQEPVYACEKNYYLETVSAYDIYAYYYYSVKFFLDKFPVKEAQQLPVLLRRCILEHLKDMGCEYDYCFSQDANRMGSSIVKADFNLDGEDDYAVVMQNGTTNASYNRIMILCYNPDISKYYVAFSDYYSGLAIIKPFNKDARIFIESEALVKSPNAGIIYQLQSYAESDFGKYAIFYDPESKQFRQCVQVPLSQQYNEDYDDYEEEYEEEYDEGYDEEMGAVIEIDAGVVVDVEF